MFFALGLQGCVVVVSALMVLVWLDGTAGLAAFYGGSVAWVNAGLLYWRWRRGRFDYQCDVQRHLRAFHRSMMERFFVVVVLLALGLGVLHLAPLLLLLGFIVGQVAWIIATSALNQTNAPGANLKS